MPSETRIPKGEPVIRERLLTLSEPGYKAFHSALIPSVPPERILGVRQPKLRALAKELAGSPPAENFLRELPHYYYEEQNLHACFIERLREEASLYRALDRFLPTVDNWATCDMLSPPLFKKHPAGLLPKVREWLASGETYVIRFGETVLMRHYLGEEFRPEFHRWVAAVPTEDYYLRTMAAWYFATALSVRWEETLPYIEGSALSPETRNAAIQKAVESRRITEAQKQTLRALRVKTK